MKKNRAILCLRQGADNNGCSRIKESKKTVLNDRSVLHTKKVNRTGGIHKAKGGRPERSGTLPLLPEIGATAVWQMRI